MTTYPRNNIYLKGHAMGAQGGIFVKCIKELIGVCGRVCFANMAMAIFPVTGGRDFVANCLKE